jgi:hypothetical protein
MSALSDRRRTGRRRGRPIGTSKLLHERKIRFDLAIFMAFHKFANMEKYKAARWAMMFSSEYEIDVIDESPKLLIKTTHDLEVENRIKYLVDEYNQAKEMWGSEGLVNSMEFSWLSMSSACFLILFKCDYGRSPPWFAMNAYETLLRLGWKDRLLRIHRSFSSLGDFDPVGERTGSTGRLIGFIDKNLEELQS